MIGSGSFPIFNNAFSFNVFQGKTLKSVEWLKTISLRWVECFCMANVALLPVACKKNIFILTYLPVQKEMGGCLITIT